MKTRYAVEFYLKDKLVELLYFQNKLIAEQATDSFMRKHFPDCRAIIFDTETGKRTECKCESE